jgi:phosphatidylserine decarboxylase
VPKLARGSGPWLAASGAATLAAAVLAFLAPPAWLWWTLAAVGLLSFLFFLQFFRDPERAVADGVASPADGKVVRIDQVEDADVGPADRLAIFMSPKDVHVNRVPLDGTVVEVRRVAGGHLPAFRKDSDRNERVETILDTDLGRVKVIQIAGTVARRIVPYLQGGDVVRKGDRLGLIRLGSRCDLLVPPATVRWAVALGEQVHGSKTRVAELVPAAPARGSAKAPSKGKPAARRQAAARKAAAPKPAARGRGKGAR